MTVILILQYFLLCFSVKVKIRPDQRVFIGETVTLTCVIQGGGNNQWTYSWFKDGYDVCACITSADYSFTADLSDSGKYSCRGERPDSYTDFSDGVTLTVSGESSYSHLFNHHLISIFQHLSSATY